MEEKPKNEGTLIRREITPNGTVVEYHRNEHGGEDVKVFVTQIASGSKVQPLHNLIKQDPDIE